MTSGTPDMVDLALRHALAINNLGPSKKLQERLRARVRDLPSLVKEVGLVPALLFYLSKSASEKKENMYDEAARLLGCDGNGNSGGALSDSTEMAYALIARAVLCAIKKLLPENNSIKIDRVDKAIESLLDIREGRLGDEVSLSMELEDYLLTLKRAGEALWEGGQE